ncbi:MAG: DUF3793 family protein [Anaerovoracaceae bacterium]
MSTDLIIRHCAPTLAGMKVGSLFAYNFLNLEQLYEDIKKLNFKMMKKDIFYKILSINGNRAMIYVYRKSKLNFVLTDERVQNLLKDYGYNFNALDEAIDFLCYRIKISKDFPHEIGVFLGYPIEDTECFIKNKGCNFKCSGHWKVYCNVSEAKKTFEKFRKCKNVYLEKFSQGYTLEKLTV